MRLQKEDEELMNVLIECLIESLELSRVRSLRLGKALIIVSTITMGIDCQKRPGGLLSWYQNYDQGLLRIYRKRTSCVKQIFDFLVDYLNTPQNSHKE